MNAIHCVKNVTTLQCKQCNIYYIDGLEKIQKYFPFVERTQFTNVFVGNNYATQIHNHNNITNVNALGK